jgi:hypothetical protein
MSKLVELLVRLAEDDELVKAFKRNPERTMQEFGVEPTDRDLVLYHDLHAIRQRLAAEAAGQMTLIICPPTICPPTVCEPQPPSP